MMRQVTGNRPVTFIQSAIGEHVETQRKMGHADGASAVTHARSRASRFALIRKCPRRVPPARFLVRMCAARQDGVAELEGVGGAEATWCRGTQ